MSARNNDRDLAISVNNINKAYTVWKSPALSLRVAATRAFCLPLSPNWLKKKIEDSCAKHYRTFNALSDVSFEVKKGETVGIIGPNGAGKSTLLKLVAGTIQPTSGSVMTNGKISALLELATGFNSDFSGRENVFLNGIVLGLTEKEIRDKFDEIADFADIGEFIEEPVKSYSSGMVMRLAFACSTVLTPDILIVDEALGVGDVSFQAKCLARMRKLVDNGSTILFTSHSTTAVRSFCHKALYLDKGKALMWGDVKEVCEAYDKACWRKMGVLGDKEGDQETENEKEMIDLTSAPLNVAETDSVLVAAARSEFEKASTGNISGSGQLAIKNVYFTDASGSPCRQLTYGEPVTLNWEIEAQDDISSEIELTGRINTPYGRPVCDCFPLVDLPSISLRKGERKRITCQIPIELGSGDYYFATAFTGGKNGTLVYDGTINHSECVIYAYVEHAIFFSVSGPKRRGTTQGVVLPLNPNWTID